VGVGDVPRARGPRGKRRAPSRHRRRRSTALFALSTFGAAFIGYIVWYQAAILDAVCASCTTSLILLLALAVVSGVVARASVR
jgi:uncharacterized membrane protein